MNSFVFFCLLLSPLMGLMSIFARFPRVSFLLILILIPLFLGVWSFISLLKLLKSSLSPFGFINLVNPFSFFLIYRKGICFLSSFILFIFFSETRGLFGMFLSKLTKSSSSSLLKVNFLKWKVFLLDDKSGDNNNSCLLSFVLLFVISGDKLPFLSSFLPFKSIIFSCLNLFCIIWEELSSLLFTLLSLSLLILLNLLISNVPTFKLSSFSSSWIGLL